VSVFFVFQQVTGINIPLYYGPHLLGPIFSGAHADLVRTTVAGVEITAIMTAVNVASTYLGFRWIDKFGRKALAIGGYTGMIVFRADRRAGPGRHPRRQLAAGGHHDRPGLLHRIVRHRRRRHRLDPAGRGVPTAVRGQAAAFCAMIDWLANFLLIEVFPVWQNAISLAGVLVCFAALAVTAIVFVWKFLPETRHSSRAISGADRLVGR
jgi:Sugar (and other) transporter